jgi:hypothetical protein
MLFFKRALLALAVLAFVLTFSGVVETKTAHAAAKAEFVVSCSSVVLKITGAPAGTFYDLFIVVPGVGPFYNPPVPTVGGAVEIVVTFPAAPEGTFIYADTWQFFPVIPTFASTNKRCGFEGPALPAGFVPAEITCDVTVFQVPNPDFQTSASLRKGQVWFVNPKPVPAQIDTFYKEWTEVFVSGPRNGFIPTACVRLISR